MGDSYEDFVNAINEDNIAQDLTTKVSDLSVMELKQIIQQIVKETVMEEVSKINFVQTIPPTQRWYGPEPTWMKDVWCSEFTTQPVFNAEQNPTTEINKEIM